MTDHDTKRIILARRAKFVAAALAGLNAVMCGGEKSGDPQPCLSVALDDGGTPQPCLAPPLDASREDAADAAADAAEPQPCLSPPQPGGDGG